MALFNGKITADGANGETSTRYITYDANCHVRHVQPVLALLADALQPVRFDAPRLERERTRALDEWLAGNGTQLQAAAIQAQAERLRAE